MPAERDPACEPQTRASRLALLLYYAAYFASWLLLPALLGEEPAHDNLEQLDWARHPALGYSKHPPLPTWVLWLFEQIFPTGVNLTYALGGLTVAAMLGCAWYVTRCLLGGRLAWRATLLCTVVTWYTLRMNFYNHNSVLLATTAASFAALVHALRRDRARDWMLLGLCWGAGMLSKYEMVVGIACNLLGLALVEPRWSRRLRALALAGATSLSIFAPHAWWLVVSDFPPVHYAARFVGAALGPRDRLERLLSFNGGQLLRIAPLLVVIGSLSWCARRTTIRVAPGAPPPSPPSAPLARRLLMVHALGPLVIFCALGVLAGVDLEMAWGTAYLWMIPLWVVSLRRYAPAVALADGTWLSAVATAQGVLVVGSVISNWK